MVSRLRHIHITSIDELRAAAPLWDDLWWRGDVALPTYRAELLAQWVDQFAPNRSFHALVVEDQGQWVAALPLVHRRLGRVLDVGVMPANQWSSRGDFLLDSAADVEDVLDGLTAAMSEIPWQLLWLDDVPVDTYRFQALAHALERSRTASDCHRNLEVGWISTEAEWESFRAGWSRKHRQQMSRHLRRLGRTGDVEFEMLSHIEPDQVGRWMRLGMEVEDRSWKGEAGTSVLRSPEMFRFFVEQASQAARWGQLRLSFLRLDHRPIAFAYGISAKGVYHSCKCGYDSRYAAFSPGQLLRYHLLEAFCADPECRAVDCLGPMTDAHRKWKPAPYALGKMIVAPRRLLGRMSLQTYKHVWPYVRRMRGEPSCRGRSCSAGSLAEGQPSLPARTS